MPSNIDKGKAPSAAGESPFVDPTIWKALAGTSPNFPPAGSTVYYFFDGHAEQCSYLPGSCSFAFECRLAAVNLHIEPTTDQLFATFTLDTDFSSPAAASKTFPGGGGGGGRVTSVAKTLTKTETNYSSETFLRLPESADNVFRYLRTGEDVDAYDLNNRRWTFRHVVSGSPPRRFLTNGWSHFVSSKMLVAGDAVVFVRDDDGIIFVGCRRCRYYDGIVSRANTEASSRLTTMKLLNKREDPETVIEIVRWAEEDGEGTVEGRYYTDSNNPVYVVEKEVVDDAMGVQWTRGIRVSKMLQKGDGSIHWLLGTVVAISPEPEITPWRMLEVIWETYNTTFENPWELKAFSLVAKTPKEEIQSFDK